MRLDGDVRVEAGERAGGARGLRPADLGGGVEDLALEVGEADRVVVDDAEGADARGGEVEERRAAEAPCPDHEHAGGAEALLAGAADLVQHDVAGVAGELVRVEGHPPVPVEPKPPVAAGAGGERLGLGPGDAGDRREDHLGDAVAVGDGDGLGPEVDEDDADLAAVVAVDGAGGVEQRQALAQGEARARADLHLVAGAGSRGRGRSGRGRGRRGRG